MCMCLYVSIYIYIDDSYDKKNNLAPEKRPRRGRICVNSSSLPLGSSSSSSSSSTNGGGSNNNSNSSNNSNTNSIPKFS